MRPARRLPRPLARERRPFLLRMSSLPLAAWDDAMLHLLTESGRDWLGASPEMEMDALLRATGLISARNAVLLNGRQHGCDRVGHRVGLGRITTAAPRGITASDLRLSINVDGFV